MDRGLRGVLATGGSVAGLAWIATTGCGETGAESAATGSFTVLSTPRSSATGEAPAPPDPAIWQTPQPDAGLEQGRLVWTGTCIACHSTGLGGAPLIGNETLWAPRIAKGLDTLVAHATEGYFGEVGEMPARGGNAALSDDEVRAAVVFMTSRVR